MGRSRSEFNPSTAGNHHGRFGLFSPLPDDRRLIFVNRDETDQLPELPTADELAALLNARVGVDVGLRAICSGLLISKCTCGLLGAK